MGTGVTDQSSPALISHKEIYLSNAHALLVSTVRGWKGEKAMLVVSGNEGLKKQAPVAETD